MKSQPINSMEASFIAQNSNLSSYLSALNRGRPATPHSWLYEEEDSETTLERWIKILEAANNKTEFGEEFNQFDRKQIEKFGPQGQVPPVTSPEAQEVIEPLYSPSEFDDAEALSAYFDATKEFAKVLFGPRLCTNRPLSFEHVVDDMNDRDTLSTNSGFPRFTTRSLVREEEIQDAISGVAYEYPAILLFRQYNGKLRPVWMFPMSMNLIEGSFQQVIQNALQHSPTDWIREYLTPWEGYDDVKRTLTTQWSGQPIVGGDTTKMDAHMRQAQIRLVFEIVKWLFQKSYWKDLEKTLLHVNSIPMLYSETEKYIGLHGLASGSCWTQITETILQMFLAWLENVHGQGIGDDFYWLTDMDADRIVDVLAKLGLPANPDKQNVGTVSVTFLQRLNRQGFFSREDRQVLGAYYPTIRALNSSLNPEKFHKPKLWNSDMFCARQYMILENTCDDPGFEEFVNFVVHGQKDLIAFAKKSDASLDEIQKQARLVPGLNPSYNQEKRNKPLSTFQSIQYARTLQ